MKSLRESLLDDELVEKTDNLIRDGILAFLVKNYKGSYKISEKPNKDDLYEVSCTNRVNIINENITSLTNGYFIWTIVKGSFICHNCNSLKSLEGAPKEVGGKFNCSHCNSLTSLEGAPKKVGCDFYCNINISLKSLEGAPKEISGDFYCNSNKSLKSLEGAPKEVGRDFHCYDCAGKFTKEDVKKISNVKKDIIC